MRATGKFNRRSFLTRSCRSIGVGALLFNGLKSGKAYAARVTPSDQVRIAVIGTRWRKIRTATCRYSAMSPRAAISIA
jgi:hypothetical protein